MKKIMFDDKLRLTEAVLSGRKTMTRRFAEKVLVDDQFCFLRWDGEFKPSRYKVGEVVAVAQPYSHIFVDANLQQRKGSLGDLITGAGWKNKMFVQAKVMPHRIEIDSVRLEHLQDISDEDCLKEGIYEVPFCEYGWEDNGATFNTPREAFAALIDKVSGKGTWASNPFVYVYEFKKIV